PCPPPSLHDALPICWVASNTDTDVGSLDVPSIGGPPLADSPEAIYGSDPTSNRERTSVASVARRTGNVGVGEVVAQDEWVRHLVDRKGTRLHSSHQI